MPTMWVDLLGTQVRYLGDRFKTRVVESGSGAPLILIHGVGGHAEAYSRNINRLAENGFRAMAIDLLWHGYSAKPPFTNDAVPTYAQQILDLMDAEGIERAHIEGESLGGWVGMWMALEHPERIDRLILNTTAGVRFAEGSVHERPHEGRDLLRERSLEAINNPNRDTIRKRLEWLMASPDRVTDELVDVRLAIYTDPHAQAALHTVFENSFGFGSGPSRIIPEARLADLKAPTLVLWSDKNPGTGPDVGRHIASLIPGSQFYCVDDAAHWPQWEHPEEHDRVVTEFLLGGNVGDS